MGAGKLDHQHQHEQQQLATPPGSTRLEAQLSDFLPDLTLPPSHVSLPIKSNTKQDAFITPELRIESAVQKRPRHAALASRKRTSSHAALEEHDAEDVDVSASEEQPLETSASGKPRKRQPKPSRKTTHSQIEKRRREKINETMQRLKALVPACHAPGADALRKLDVLTETADYIDVLHARLARIETAGASPLASRPASQAGTSMERSRESSLGIAATFFPVSAGQGFATPPSEQGSDRLSLQTMSPLSETRLGRAISQTSSRDQPYSASHGQVGLTAAEYLDASALTAAESLVQISESPMLGPVKRMSIAEMMHL